MKWGDALERFASVDAVVVDKTGTLTLGRPEIAEAPPAADLAAAAALAGASRHPLCQAVVRATPGVPVRAGVREETAAGLTAPGADGETRLGSCAWCGVSGEPRGPGGPEL